MDPNRFLREEKAVGLCLKQLEHVYWVLTGQRGPTQGKEIKYKCETTMEMQNDKKYTSILEILLWETWVLSGYYWLESLRKAS